MIASVACLVACISLMAIQLVKRYTLPARPTIRRSHDPFSNDKDIETPSIVIGPKGEMLRVGHIELTSFLAYISNNNSKQGDSMFFSWIDLLDQCRDMERKSRDWEKLSWLVEHDILRPDIEENEDLVVVIEKDNDITARYSLAIKQAPFAVTSMHYLVELVAILGLRWVFFDSEDRCLAAGNGYTLTGERKMGAKIIFRFQINSPSSFAAKRIIPSSEVRGLCRGVVSTFYRITKFDETHAVPQAALKGLEILRVSTSEMVIDTLRIIGCSTRSIRAYQVESTNSILPFPGNVTWKTLRSVTFELTRPFVSGV
jgi:hypothetical protein